MDGWMDVCNRMGWDGKNGKNGKYIWVPACMEDVCVCVYIYICVYICIDTYINKPIQIGI